MKTKHRLAGYIVLGLALAAVIALNFLFPGLRQLASPSFVREYLLDAGAWGYLLYVIIFLLSIPLPIPSMPLAVVGGYVFGLVLGIILTMIAAVIGASIAFFLVRRYGEPILEKMVSKHHVLHFQHIFRQRGVNGAIIAYAIPVFPSDTLNFIMGMMKIRWHTFLLIVILGNIPRYLIVTALGENLHLGFTAKSIITVAFAALFLLIALFREKLKKVVFKELRTLEKELGKEAYWVEQEIKVMERQTGISRWRWKLRYLGKKRYPGKKEKNKEKEKGQTQKKNELSEVKPGKVKIKKIRRF